MAYDVDDRIKKEEERKRSRRVYSTESINQLIKDAQEGYEIDYAPFFMRDLELRAPNTTFEMTEEEMEEYQKCFDDSEYFIEKYAKFLTDRGREPVKLRDFQKNVIRKATEETYIESIEDFGPMNRNIIWMASRQSGKCIAPWTTLNVSASDDYSDCDKYIETPIYELFDMCEKNNSILHKIKRCLYRLYMKL